MERTDPIAAAALGALGPLGSGQLRVFYAPVPELEDPACTERQRRVLSDEERARQLRFHFAHDRQSYLVAHTLTRTVLGSALGVNTSQLQFELGAHGRPELIAQAGRAPLRFNLSHTRGMVACAIAWELDVGVDVEQVDRRVEIEQLARQVFSERERAALLALPESERRERFFRLWTLKESYIKAVGKGLAIPLRSISLQIDPLLHPHVEFTAPIADAPELWQFRTWRPLASHMLSVAARCQSGLALAISVHELAV